MQVRDVMTAAPRAVRSDATLHEAARAMWAQGCGSLPVVDGEGALVGMVTDRDICLSAMIQEAKLADVRVADAMSPVVRSCRADDTLRDAERAMQEQGVRRLPILDERSVLVGVLSIDDLAVASARQAGVPADGLSPAEICATLAAVAAPRAQVEGAAR